MSFQLQFYLNSNPQPIKIKVGRSELIPSNKVFSVNLCFTHFRRSDSRHQIFQPIIVLKPAKHTITFQGSITGHTLRQF